MGTEQPLPTYGLHDDQPIIIDDGDDKYELGFKGQAIIRKMLSNRNPVNVIHEFQERNGLSAPHTDAVLNFLDLLGISRASVYSSLSDKLQRYLLERVKQASAEQMDQLLRESFRFIRIAGLQKIPVEILCSMQVIPKDYLDQLALYPELVEILPLPILRQLWVSHPQLLQAKLLPLITSFVSDENRIKIYQSFSELTAVPSDRRSSDPILQTLVSWIGTSFPLYDLCVRQIRDRFATTNHYGYCVLRMELLMAIHDMDRGSVAAQDPLHQLTWCLDAASREHIIEGRLMNELTGQYVQFKEASDVTSDAGDIHPSVVSQLQDLSMIIAHPFVTNVLLRSIEFNLNRIVRAAQNDMLPKDDEPIRILTQILYVGCNVRKLLRARKQFKLPKCPNGVFRRFYPLLGLVVLKGSECLEEASSGLNSLLLTDKGQIGLSVLIQSVVSYLSSCDYERAKILLGVITQIDPATLTVHPLSLIDRFAASFVSKFSQDHRHKPQFNSNPVFRQAQQWCSNFINQQMAD